MADTRRDALKIIGAIGATCAFPFSADELYGQVADHNGHALVQVQQVQSATPIRLLPDEYKIATRLADLIIPDTNTPGAVVAGVPRYIDFVLSQNKAQLELFREGSAALMKAGFLTWKEEEQIRFLTPLSEAVKPTTSGEKFFALVKNLTADGYFTSKIGLIQTLGYKGNSVHAEFPGCTHEH